MTTHLFRAWDDVARRLARVHRLAVFTDFDGTLAPIRRRASEVRLDPEIRCALGRLAAHGHVIGIISGRSLEDLITRVGLPDLWYVGGHGFLVRAPNGRTITLLTRHQRREIADAARRLRAALRGTRGLTIEEKTSAVAVHYRSAPIASRRAAEGAVRRVMLDQRGLRVMHGKKVLELLPPGEITKAVAIRSILRVETRRRRHLFPFAIYLGDDVADERVFETWPGLSVAVGRRPRTAAQYYLRSPAEVGTLLDRLQEIH